MTGTQSDASSVGCPADSVRGFLRLNPCFVAALMLAGALGVTRPEHPAPTAIDPSQTVEVTGVIASPLEYGLGRLVFEVEPEIVTHKERRIECGHRVRVTIWTGSSRTDTDRPWFFHGDRIRFRARLRDPGYFATPGVADFRVLLARRGVRHQAHLKSLLQVEHVAPSSRPSPLHRYLRGFEASCRRNVGPEGCRLVTGAMLGRRGWMREHRDELNRLGILHLFVVSGFHVSLVLAVVHKCTPWAGAPRTIICLGMMWCYIGLAGFSVSTLRAGIMISLFYLLVTAGMTRQILNSIGVAALLILGADPEALRTAAFQFSFLALVSIAFYVAPIHARVSRLCRALGDVGSDRVLLGGHQHDALRRRLRFWLEARIGFLPTARRLSAFIGVLARFLTPLAVCTFFVQVFCLPISIHYTNQVSWLQLPVNLFLTPAVMILIVLGLLFLLAYPSPLGPVLGEVLGAYTYGLQAVIQFVAGYSTPHYFPHPRPWECVLYLLLFVALRWLGKRLRKPIWVLLPLALLAQLSRPPAFDEAGVLRLTMLDVGQGESIHIRYPDGSHALVDTGGSYAHGTGVDFIGQRVTSRYLWQTRIKRLGYILLTHPHIDHDGAYRSLRNRFDSDSLLFHRAREDYDAAGARKISRGEVFLFGGVRHQVLHPSRQDAPSLNANDASLVVLLRYGGFSILLTGDISAGVERTLVEELAPVTVLKTPHHGSRSSSSRPFLEAARPLLALTSSGRENPFGHPSPATLEHMRAAGIPHFATSFKGSLRITTDGCDWKLERFSIRRGIFVDLISGRTRACAASTGRPVGQSVLRR